MLLQLRQSLRWISGFGIAVLFAAAPLFAGTITVTSAGDSGAWTLRQAILDSASGDTINFSLPPGTTAITLTSDQLLINKNLTITGHGANLVSVVRGRATGQPFFHFRIFDITLGSVSISGLTIANGNAFTGGTGIQRQQKTKNENKEYDNSTFKKINQPRRLSGLSSHRALLLCAFAGPESFRGSPEPDAGRRVSG